MPVWIITLVQGLIGQSKDLSGERQGKGLVRSKTAYGVVLMALPLVLGWFGLEWGEADLQTGAEQITVMVGAALAIYGRVKATGKI